MSAFCDRLVTAPLLYTHTGLGAAHISRLLRAQVRYFKCSVYVNVNVAHNGSDAVAVRRARFFQARPRRIEIKTSKHLCGILKSWDFFISMRRGRAWKKRARRTATASLPLWRPFHTASVSSAWAAQKRCVQSRSSEGPLPFHTGSVCSARLNSVFCTEWANSNLILNTIGLDLLLE